MSTSLNALLGVAFLVLAFATTFSMYQFWGYPFDKETGKSECPQWKMNIHRALGFGYALIYIILMIQMVPRLWSYQVEFPARTVAHIICGLSIGVLLIVKLSILRFFRHFEEWMPVLGTLLLWFTVLLAGLSLPFVLEESVLAGSASGDDAVSQESRARAQRQLARIDFGVPVDVAELATRDSMLAGREVLLSKCVYCHDLKTAIAKPKTAVDWWRTVGRMAKKPTLGPRMTADDQRVVTAYLVAITPDLQDSAAEKQKRLVVAQKTAEMLVELPAQPVAKTPADAPEDSVVEGAVAADGDPETATPVSTPVSKPKPKPTAPKSVPTPKPAKPVAKVSYDAKLAKAEFDDLCTQCHDASDVDDAPPADRADARDTLRRMIEHGLEADEKQLVRLEEYMVRRYIKK